MENQQVEFTDAEIQEKKAEMISFFKEQVEILTAQKEYETVLTELDELRARRALANMRVTQIMAPPPSPESTPEEESKARSLKKEK